MRTVQTSVLRRLGEALVPEAPEALLSSSSGFRIAPPPPEIPTVGAATLEIPMALIRKFPGPEKNCYLYRVSGLFGKFSFGCVPGVTVFAVGF